MFPLLIFMFCFFLGSACMFFYSLKKRESLYKNLSDEHAQLRVLMRAMESRLDNMEKYLGQCSGLSTPEKEETGREDAQLEERAENAGHDPLLHVSFEDPGRMKDARDPALELMLDTPEDKKSS